MAVPHQDQETLTADQKMAQFQEPAIARAPQWKTAICKLLALTALVAGSLYCLENQSASIDSKAKSDPDPSINLAKSSLPILVKPSVDYQISQASAADILNGRATIKLGDGSPVVQRFVSCFNAENFETYLTPKIQTRIFHYQLTNKLKLTGEIDHATILELQKNGIIEFGKRSETFQLGKNFFPLVYDPCNQADCLQLARNFLSQSTFGQLSHGIENLLITRGEYSKVVQNSLRELGAIKNPTAEDRQLEDRLIILEKALEYGISRPLMFTNGNLESLVANYQAATPAKFNACLVVTSYDHNGAFYNLYGFNELTSYFLRNGANVRFVMPVKDSDLETNFAAALTIRQVPCKADFVIYCFHGYPTGFQVGATKAQESFLNLGEGHLRSLNYIIKSGATEILYSCSTADAKSTGGEDTLAESLHNCRSKRSEVLAPRTDCNLLVGRYVSHGTGTPIRLKFDDLPEPLMINFIAPQLAGILGEEGKYPQAAVTRLKAHASPMLSRGGYSEPKKDLLKK